VNVEAMTYLNQKYIPIFLERQKRCAIINLSSLSVFFTLKGLSVYAGTKAFNNHFSRCLAQDYKGRIDILSCLPGIVSTAGTGYTTDPMSCTAEQCVKWTLKALGKTESTAGHWSHTLQYWMTLVTGETLTQWLGNLKKDAVTVHKKE
jgi:17beta-estradiol 17-dehydrogenase / very-long-chain 3-oxoacyl-CoA reductase